MIAEGNLGDFVISVRRCSTENETVSFSGIYN